MTNIAPEIFRPNAVVSLRIRLEEFNDDGSLRARLSPARGGAPEAASVEPERPGALTDPAAREAALLRLAEVDGEISRLFQQGPDGYPATFDFEAAQRDLAAERDELMSGLTAGNPIGGTADQPPGSIDGPSPDDRVALGGIVPISLTVERNALRTADTATVTINHSDAPFDPRLIRACAIEVVFGVIDPGQYERGQNGTTRSDGSRLSLPERGTRSRRAPNTTRFVGVVDNWQVSYDGEDGDKIELTCRDLSALLFDEPLGQGQGIDLTLPLDEAVRAFLDRYPSLRGTRVVWAGTGDPPTLGNATPSRVTATRGGAQRQVRTGDQRMTCWDHIVETCARAGLVPIFVDYELRIINPRTFYASSGRARRMVYGRNLGHLEFTRKIGGVQVPTIEVRSYDPTIGRTRWARYPSPPGQIAAGVIGVSDPPVAPSRPNVPLVSGHNPTERIATYLVASISDPNVLRGIARSTFEQIGRQEIEGNFETDSVYTVDAVGDDADLLSIDSGDPVELLVTRSRGDGGVAEGLTAAEIASLSRAARVDYLRRLGWSQRVAERFAVLQESTAFQTVFRVQNVRLSFSVTEGYKVAVDFVNYVTAREDQTAETEEDYITAGPTEGAAARRASVPEGAENRTEAQSEILRMQARRDALYRQRAAGQISQEQFDANMTAADARIRIARDSESTVGASPPPSAFSFGGG